MPSSSSSSSGSAALLVAAAAATSLIVFGLGVGVGCRFSSSSSSSVTRKTRTSRSNRQDDDGMDGRADADLDLDRKRQQQQQSEATTGAKRQHLCECGFDLTPLSSHAISLHRISNLHRSNLYRTRGAQLLLTAKVNEYRRAIGTHVNDTDVVLEVGCAEGLTTQRLAQRARVAIGIDLYTRLIDRARRRVGMSPEEEDDDAGCAVASRASIGAGAQRTDDDDNGDSSDGVSKEMPPVVNVPPGRGWSNLHFYTADAMDKKAVLRAVNRALGMDDAKYEESKRLERARVDKLIEEELMKATTATTSTSSGEQSSNHGISASSVDELSNKQRRLLRRAAVGRQDCADITNRDGDTAVPTILRSTGRLHTGRVNKIWLDVSGSRETRTVVQLVEILDAMFRPELIVVKSDKLKNMARRMHLPSSVIPGITHEADNTPYVIS